MIRAVDEHYMVWKFLDAELSSPRYESRLRSLMAPENVPAEFIRAPDLQDEEQNSARDRLLTRHRGWKNNQALFEGFPAHAEWHEIELAAEEIDNLSYINADHWRQLSGGSRFVKDAVWNIRQGHTAGGECNQKYFDIAAVIEDGRELPEMIFVTADSKSKLIILEGHYRATGYGLATSRPSNIRALLGIHPDIVRWRYF